MNSVFASIPIWSRESVPKYVCAWKQANIFAISAAPGKKPAKTSFGTRLKERLRLRQAAGLNYIDVYHRAGYYSQPLPFIPGLEGAGTVEAIGQDVRGLKVRFESQGRPES